MSNEQCCLCGAVGHDSKDCGMRAEFEGRFGLSNLNRITDEDGFEVYEDEMTQIAWAAWCSAWQSARAQPAEQSRSEWGNVAPDSDGKYHIKQPVNVIKQAAEKHGVPYPALADALREVNSIMHPHGPWFMPDAVSPFGKVHAQPEAAQPVGEAVAWHCIEHDGSALLRWSKPAADDYCKVVRPLVYGDTAPLAQPAGEAVALPFAIMPDEMKALRRFHECVTDGEGYDVSKDMMKRLAEIGLVRRVTANIYEHTNFGLSVLNGDFDTAPPAQVPSIWRVVTPQQKNVFYVETAAEAKHWADQGHEVRALAYTDGQPAQVPDAISAFEAPDI